MKGILLVEEMDLKLKLLNEPKKISVPTDPLIKKDG